MTRLRRVVRGLWSGLKRALMLVSLISVVGWLLWQFGAAIYDVLMYGGLP